jgi:hypothetical protein
MKFHTCHFGWYSDNILSVGEDVGDGTHTANVIKNYYRHVGKQLELSTKIEKAHTRDQTSFFQNHKTHKLQKNLNINSK